MTTFAWTFYPIQVVLEAGGRINFQELARTLMSRDPRRFRDERTVQYAIETYTRCLKYDGAAVTFDRTAKTYARLYTMERDVQSVLHKAIANMEQWQLYPFFTRKNSPKCYIGAQWRFIPQGKGDEEFPSRCDFRRNGEDSCDGNGGIPEEQLIWAKIF